MTSPRPSSSSIAHLGAWKDRGDPLDASRHLAARHGQKAAWGALVIATAVHGAFVARGAAMPLAMQRWAQEARHQVHDYLWATYDIELPDKPAPPKPATPDEPPEEKLEQAIPIAPAPTTAPAAAKAQEPPPPAAKAGKILSAPEQDGDKPVDLTGDGFVTGDGDEYVGGVTAAAGTGTQATYNPRASLTGKPGANGTGSAASRAIQAPEPDRSRPATVSRGANWSSCPFPEEADMDQVDYAVVSLVVNVRPDGTPRSVRVLRDPGHGFGRAARMCALSMRYVPALDKSGKQVMGTTPPINVRFTR